MMDSAASTVSVTISGRIRDTVMASVIVLPAFLDHTPEKVIAKTWRILHRNADINAAAITALDSFFPLLLNQAEARWRLAQKEYSVKWVDPRSVDAESFSAVTAQNREHRVELHMASDALERYKRCYWLYERYKKKYQ